MLTAICDRCGTRHDLDASRVPASGLTMKCTRCGNPLHVAAAGAELGTLDDLDLPDPNQPDDRISFGLDANDIVDLPTPKGAPPRRGAGAADEADLVAPVGPVPNAKKKELEDPDLVAPVGPIPTRAMPAATALPKAPSIPAPPIGGRNAPAAPPPPPKAKPVEDDLLAPVGPTSQKGIPDLLTPVGPTSQKGIPDLLAPVGPTSQKGIPDLLTPIGPTPSKIPSRPPGGPVKVPTMPPAGAKVPTNPPGGKPVSVLDDQLLMPVGPTPQRSSPDLLQPVGPLPTRSKDDLLTPVGPTPVKNAPGLLTPVGPQPVRNAPDLLEPVGPVPTRGKDDLLTPVGPTPVRNAPGLLTPVGPQPVRNAPDLLSPVGPHPTKGLDLPAPQGFFEDHPPPNLRPGFTGSAPTSAPPGLSLDDDLDIVPAGHAPGRPPPTLDLFGDEDETAARPSNSMDGLDLPPPDAPSSELGYGEVDLPPTSDDLAGVVSFSAPPGGPTAPRPSPSLAPESVVPVARVDAKVGRVAPTPTKAPLSKEQRGRRNKIFGVILALLILGGGGYWVYQNIELEVLGFRTAPSQERADRIVAGLSSMRKLMGADERGHWDQVVAAGKRVLSLDPKNVDAMALSAQAQIAAFIDEGTGGSARKEAADDMIGELIKVGAKGPELEKAQALRSVIDTGKGDDAKKALAALGKKLPKDADVALYLGWAALADKDHATAAASFAKAGERLPALYGMGLAQLAAGERDKARATFEKVVAKQPEKKHIGAWLALVEIQTEPGDKNRESELAAICEKAPERMNAHPRDLSRAWMLYADEALIGARYELAVERYRQARKLDGTNLGAMVGGAMSAVEVYEQTGGKADLAEARRELEQAIQLDQGATGVRALVGLTRINLVEGKPVEARAAIEKAAQLDPKSAVVQLWLGRVLSNAAINEPKAAEAAFRKAMELAPREFAAYVALAQLMGARGDTKGALLVLATVADAAKKDPPLANALGMAYLGAKDYPAAEAAFRTALAVDSGYAEARLNLADTLALRGRYGDAVVEYQKLRQAEPKREDVALRLATTYEKMRRFDSAEKLLRELLSTDGGNVPSTRARAAAGRFWVRQNQIALAGEQVAPLFAADPRQPTGFYLRGVVLFFDGRIDEAIKDVTEAVQIEPQSEYWETLGRMQEKKGELAPAMASFNHAIQMDATFAAPHSGLGRLHLLRRDWDAALASFQRASTLDTLDASIWAGIAEARYGRRELPDAIKAYETAIEKNGKVGEYHFRVGKFLSENDQGALAIGRFARAISLGPDNASWIHDAYRLLGYAQKAAGHKAEACDAFNSYLRKAPPNDKLRDQVNRESLSCR